MRGWVSKFPSVQVFKILSFLVLSSQVSKFPSFQVGMREGEREGDAGGGGGPVRGLGTDYMISGPIKGLKNTSDSAHIH